MSPNTADFTTKEDQTHWTPPSVEQLAPIFPELDILELIGRGGMGAVYKAREKQLDRLVALKILPPEIGREKTFAQRFAREAQAMAKLSHSNIVTIYSFGQQPAAELTGDGDLYFFIMEYVDGLSLRQLLDAGTVSPKEALAIVPQICDALQYAHDRGIVHRDIKPENILLNQQGQVKIADFGLAKLVGLCVAGAARPTAVNAEAGRPGASGVTQADEKVMGTPQYMAPEQIERPREVDHRADIYSLGVVFYQLLTGELPRGKFEPPSRKVLIDVRLDEVVLRALEHEPARRYQQVSEVRTQVETIASTSDQYQPWPSANTTRQNPPWDPSESSKMSRQSVRSRLTEFLPFLALVVFLAGFIWLAAWGRSFERSKLYFFVDILGFAAIESIALLLGVVIWRKRLGKLVVVVSGIFIVCAIAYLLTFGKFGQTNIGGWEPVKTVLLFDDTFIDFDTGVVWPSLSQDQSEDQRKFLRERGIDAVAKQASGPWQGGLMGFDMVVEHVSDDQWELMSAKDIINTVKSLRFNKKVYITENTSVTTNTAPAKVPSLTFVFKTRKGSIGLLQITKLDPIAKLVSIRYKLVAKHVL